MKKVVIIGAGASGLICAKELEKDFLVTIYELNKKIGSKVLASGNGRCNLSNVNTKPYFFPSPRISFKDYLVKHHLLTFADSEGRMYPISESSKSVLDLITPVNATIHFETPVTKITKINGKYQVNNDNTLYDYLILTSGSKASIDNKKAHFINCYLDSLNLKTSPLRPNLTAFKLANFNAKLKNIRAKAECFLYKDNDLVKAEKGEIIFKEDGVSGICIFNLSHYYNEAFTNNTTFKILLKLYPNLTDRNFKNLKYNINPLLYRVLKEKERSIDLTYQILGTADFASSQNCYGGIDLSLVNSDLSLKQDPNIYIGGELLNVSYPCGGFNLDFAFNSGLKIAEVIKERRI